MWQLEEVMLAVKGTALHVAHSFFAGVSTDSRTIQEGRLFVPLKGLHFDGHDFIEDALAKGAAGSLCDRGREKGFSGEMGTIILVEDANEALLDLARYKRAKIDAAFIALTGSNGKTTTKELLARMMETTFKVAYNERNYNNRIGVSQTILGIEDSPAFTIVELGTNNRGEIAELASLVKPDMSLITNVNPSHLQGLGDIEGVFREKTELFRATQEGGTLFINNDDPLLSSYKPGPGWLIRRFGMASKADFGLHVVNDRGLGGFDINLGLEGETVTTSTSLLGVHNLYNILAASAVACRAGVAGEKIGAAIARFQPYAGRFRSVTSKRGYTVIDDTYNANPASMEKAIAALQKLPCKGKKIAILGDMKELGEQTAYYHRELGRLLFKTDISLILLLGDQIRVVQDEVKNGRVLFFQQSAALLAHALEVVETGDIILVKGSRALKMDRIVEGLL